MDGIGVRKLNQISRLLELQVDTGYETYELIKVTEVIMTVRIQALCWPALSSGRMYSGSALARQRS